MAALSNRDLLTAQLECIRSIQNQRRIIAILGLTFSLGFLAVMFNHYVAWDASLCASTTGATTQTAAATARQYLIESWIQSRYLEVPGLGVKLSVGDISVFSGATALVVLLSYIVLVRRQLWVAQQVKARVDFLKDNGEPLAGDHAFWSITGHEPLLSQHTDANRRRITTGDTVKQALMAAIPLPVVIAVVLDALSLYTTHFPSPFRSDATTVLWEQLQPGEKVKAATFLFFGMAMALALWRLTVWGAQSEKKAMSIVQGLVTKS